MSSASSSRDFLVPIGSTGARQKLSILRPNQRRVHSVSTTSDLSSPLGSASPSVLSSRTSAASASGYTPPSSARSESLTPSHSNEGKNSLAQHANASGNTPPHVSPNTPLRPPRSMTRSGSYTSPMAPSPSLPRGDTDPASSVSMSGAMPATQPGFQTSPLQSRSSGSGARPYAQGQSQQRQEERDNVSHTSPSKARAIPGASEPLPLDQASAQNHAPSNAVTSLGINTQASKIDISAHQRKSSNASGKSSDQTSLSSIASVKKDKSGGLKDRLGKMLSPLGVHTGKTGSPGTAKGSGGGDRGSQPESPLSPTPRQMSGDFRSESSTPSSAQQNQVGSHRGEEDVSKAGASQGSATTLAGKSYRVGPQALELESSGSNDSNDRQRSKVASSEALRISSRSRSGSTTDALESTTVASSSTSDDPPELKLQLGDMTDLQSMIPEYLSFEVSAESDELASLSQPANALSNSHLLPLVDTTQDKSLPPTPESRSPMTPYPPISLAPQPATGDFASKSGAADATSPTAFTDAPSHRPLGSSLASDRGQTAAIASPAAPHVLPRKSSAARRDVFDDNGEPRSTLFDAALSSPSPTIRGQPPRPLPSPALSRSKSSAAISQGAGTSRALDTTKAELPIPSPAAVNDSRADGNRSDLTQSGAGNTVTRESVSRAEPPIFFPHRDSAGAVERHSYIPPSALRTTRKGIAVGGVAMTSAPSSQRSSDFGTMPRGWSTFGSSADTDGAANSSSETGIGAFSVYPPVRQDSLPVDEFESQHNGGEAAQKGTMLPASAWAEVETALIHFRSPSDGTFDKGALIRNVLLPFLALEAETPNVAVAEGPYRSSKARRALFFDWIANLLLELQHVQTSADRGAILESVACIIECRNLSINALAADVIDEGRFNSTFGHILLYAIGELNKKGVYQNTLIFSGRLLAVAFFRVKGVAGKLLRALPINRFALERVAGEAGWEKVVPTRFEEYRQLYPETLRDYCFSSPRTYLKILDRQSNDSQTEESDEERYLIRQPGVEVEMTGNWLRRWQSDDSELFFSFCRSFHRQLASLFASGKRLKRVGKLFFGAPGYAHLATCIHLKCLSLVNRDILSVTTLSSQKNFNPGETANVLSGSTAGKPRHLEAANRRCTAIIVDIVRAPSRNNDVFLPMLDVHIKCLVKRTSLYDVQGVFCLLDWLDGVLNHMEGADLPVEGNIDIDFIITTLSLLLQNADHALALMRTIAFSYSNFALLISTAEHRRRFCQEILLDRKIFHKLFLSWSFTIRAYFLHLLVFRLARISDFEVPLGDPKGKIAVAVAVTFNQRLDEIRKRHNDLSPDSGDGLTSDEEEEEVDDDRRDGDTSSTYSRLSRRPASFVSTIRKTPSIHQVESPANGMTKAERVLGIGLPDTGLAGKNLGGAKSKSKAAQWFRSLSKGGKSNSSEGKGSAGGSAPFVGVDNPTILNQPRMKPDAFSPLDLDDDDDDDEEEDEGGYNDDSSNFDDDGTGIIRRASLGSRGAQSEYEFDFASPRAAATAAAMAESRSSASGRRASVDGVTVSSPATGATAAESASPDLDLIASDTIFDLQNPTLQNPPQAAVDAANAHSSGTGNGVTPTRRQPSSSRMSRSFSRRTSFLPGPACDLMESADGELQDPDTSIGSEDFATAVSSAPLQQQQQQKVREDTAYAERLHVYATQGLREWEAVLAEHDEFFASIADQNKLAAVPRLPVQWPAMWSD